MSTVTILVGTLVQENPKYEVVVSGDYELYDYVPCRRIIETNGPTCAFLAVTVVGEQPSGE